MKVLFFGRLADILGPDIKVEFPRSCSLLEIRQRITTEYPQIAEALSNRRVRAFVGDTILSDNDLVQPNESVEFFPPVSGG